MFQRKKPRRIQPQSILLAGIAVSAAFTVAMVRRWSMRVDRTEIEVPATEPSPHLLQERDFMGERPLQLLSEGEADIYHRVYQVDVINPNLTPEDLIRHIIRRINDFIAGEMAHFEKTKGVDGEMEIGDEYFVHIVGPWNGPVRVIDVQPTSFSFATLEGHLESGEIQFRAFDHPDHEDAIRFEIRSWARSRDRITDFFYRILGISKYSQTRLWTFFCKRVAEECGGEPLGDIRVMTHKTHYKPEEQAQAAATTPAPLWKQYSPQFERWKTAELNFDPAKRAEYTQISGWNIDEYSIGLPSESPGEPVAGGVWEAAKQVVMNYEFPDPDLVTGIFVPDDPLNERIMIIRARFWFFTFLFGVRVSQVIDEIREGGKRGSVRVWGYSYRTLQGHFEMGEITFEVWKYIENGEVEFHMSAYSKAAAIRNPFYRIGFHIFGRGLQKRFADSALSRMQQLVLQRVALVPASDEEPIETPEVKPIAADEAATEKADDIAQEIEQEADAENSPSSTLEAGEAAEPPPNAP